MPNDLDRRYRRNKRGSQLTEAVLAAFILIPVALGMLDMIVVVIANSINDSAVKNAARAAANQTNGGLAVQAEQSALSSFKKSSIVKSLTIDDLQLDKENVTCTTKMEVHLPVPIPGCADVTFKARASEPVVGQKHSY